MHCQSGLLGLPPPKGWVFSRLEIKGSIFPRSASQVLDGINVGTADTLHVTAVAAGHAAQPVVADIAAGGHHLLLGGGEEPLIYQFPHRCAGAFIQIVDFHQVRRPAGELLVAERIDVELVAAHIFILGAVGGFEVDDDDLVGIGAADQVNAPMHHHALGKLEFDGFLGVFDLVEQCRILGEVAAQGTFRLAAQILAHDLARIG